MLLNLLTRLLKLYIKIKEEYSLLSSEENIILKRNRRNQKYGQIVDEFKKLITSRKIQNFLQS